MDYEQKLRDWCKLNYPNCHLHIISPECGDIFIAYLHNPNHSWLSTCRVVYYNTWYPDDFNVYKFVPLEKEVNNV